MIDWETLASAYAAELAGAGAIADRAWQSAFAQVQRHLFVPRYWALDEYNAPHHLVDGADPAQRDEWLHAVYTDRFLATQYQDDEGRRIITSSASLPSLVARMLGLLNVGAGQRVLEIGTGTGYNTALLCHRLGDANVTSIDIDPGLVAEATSRLSQRGYHPTVVAGDGWDGVAKSGPYDRILSTCASPGVPPAWIDQLKPGGTLVAPLTYGGALAVLTKTGPQTVSGHFATEPAWFMPLRPAGHPMPEGHLVDMPDAPRAEDTHRGTTDIDATSMTNTDFVLWLSLHLPGSQLAHVFNDSGTEHTGTIIYTAEHRATIMFAAASDGTTTVEQDARRLADTVEVAWRAWRQAGRPGRERLGITATSDGIEYAWLDKPDGPLRWPTYSEYSS